MVYTSGERDDRATFIAPVGMRRILFAVGYKQGNRPYQYWKELPEAATVRVRGRARIKHEVIRVHAYPRRYGTQVSLYHHRNGYEPTGSISDPVLEDAMKELEMLAQKRLEHLISIDNRRRIEKRERNKSRKESKAHSGRYTI